MLWSFSSHCLAARSSQCSGNVVISVNAGAAVSTVTDSPREGGHCDSGCPGRLRLYVKNIHGESENTQILSLVWFTGNT